MTSVLPASSDLAVLAPAFVLAGWTIAVLTWVGAVRVRAGLRGEITPGDFALGESSRVPRGPALANRNYMNLLEAPVLFYVVVVIAFVTGAVFPTLVVLAWAYVATRLLHSLVHLSYNNVMHRLTVFATGNVILGTMWVLLGLALWQRSTS